jgi:phage shock protein PspC (stress-responsive transcriptional regulator)
MARRLTRDPRNAVLGGVASGLADYFDVDPALVRIGFILLCLLHGLGVIMYLVAWVVMPRRDAAPDLPPPDPPPMDRVVDQVREKGEAVVDDLRAGRHRQRHRDGNGNGRIIAGVILIGMGLVFLIDRLSWLYWPHWLHLGRLWPIVLIVIGIWMIARIGWTGAPGEER